MTPRHRAELALAGVTLAWGASFILIKGALEDSSTIAFLALRFGCGAAAMAVASRRALAASGTADLASVRAGLICGSVLAAACLFQTAGLRYTTASNSAFITALSIVLVPLAAAVLDRAAPPAAEWLAAILAFSGVALMALPEDSAGLRARPGDLLTLGGAVVFTAHILATGRYAVRARLPVMNVTQFAVAAVLFGALAPFGETVRVVLTPRLMAALAVTGVVCTALAYAVQAWAQRRISASRAALIFALEPVAAAATEWLVTGHTLSRTGAAGAALVLGGVVVAEWSKPETSSAGR